MHTVVIVSHSWVHKSERVSERKKYALKIYKCSFMGRIFCKGTNAIRERKIFGNKIHKQNYCCEGMEMKILQHFIDQLFLLSCPLFFVTECYFTVPRLLFPSIAYNE
jgi:hypothetical protein